jgi:signal transduction histidine kinase
LNGTKRTVLYRVAQEAITNVARHAQASQVQVKIEKLENHICLKIRDNGKGFQAVRALHIKKNTRLGLLGMRERVEMVGGKLTIKSTAGKGTIILAEFPFNNRKRGGVPAR